MRKKYTALFNKSLTSGLFYFGYMQVNLFLSNISETESQAFRTSVTSSRILLKEPAESFSKSTLKGDALSGNPSPCSGRKGSISKTEEKKGSFHDL